MRTTHTIRPFPKTLPPNSCAHPLTGPTQQDKLEVTKMQKLFYRAMNQRSYRRMREVLILDVPRSR